jgi:MFS superfamily sulfate permease-like transporter
MGDATRFGELSAALAILVGIVLVVLGLLHMGFVSRFISASVQAGFMFGLGLTIIVGQVPALLGVAKGGGDFFPQLWQLLTRLGDVNGWTAAVGLGGLALLLALRRVAPGIPTPAPPCAPDRPGYDLAAGWLREKNSSALRVLGSCSPAALSPWPATNLVVSAYTWSTFWGVALVDSSTSGTWPG